MQTDPVTAPIPVRGLRSGALLVSAGISLAGALLVLFALPGQLDHRAAATWALVQFLSGVWAGVLGANSPFLHGLIAGVPALALGLIVPSPLPPQFVIVAWFIAPSGALVAAAIMRFMRRR